MSNFNLSHDEYKYLQKTIFGVDLDAKGSRGRGQSQMEDESPSSAELIVNQYKQPEEQGFFADVVDSVQMGAWQGVGDLARGMGALFNSDWLNQAADFAARNAEANRETMSTKMQEALGQNAFDGWDSETGEGKGVANIYWWAGNLGALIGQNIDTVVTMGAGKLATTGIKAGGKLAGKYFSKEVADQVGKAAVKQASRFGIPAKYHKTIGYTAVMSAMSAGGRANKVREELSKFSNEELAQQHGFQTAYWDLKDSEEGQSLSDNEIFERARQQYYNEVGRDVMLDPAAIAADVTANAIGGLGGGVWGMPNVNKLLGKPAKSITGGLFKGALVEAGTEGIQGAAEQYAINDTAKEYYDPDRELTKEVSQNAINSMALGAGFGGVMGGYEAGSHNRAMNRQKKRLLEAVSTGDERVDAQIRAQVEAYNRMANELDELVSPERLQALNQAGLQAVEKNKRRAEIEAEVQAQVTNAPYHQRNLADIQAEFIQHGLGENDFNDFIEANLQQATADLQNLQTNPFRMGADLQKGLAEKQAYQAKLADAQARVNFFTQAKNAPKSGTEPSQVEGQSELQINTDDIKLSRSAMKSVEANIVRGREAMTKAILEKSSVHRAMYRNDLDGWVDFEWGDVGKMLPNGKTKGAMGLAHIIDKRMAVDGMSEQEVTRFLVNDITETIAKGTIDRENVFEKTRTVQISYNGNEVRITKKQGNNGWVVTGFKQYQPMNQSRGATTSDLRNIDPIRSRIEMGATGTENLPSFTNDVKFSRSAQQETQSFYETEQRLGGKEAYEQAVKEGKTELDYHQWVQVRTPEFKAWFGDWENDPQNASKVINPKTGEPLVVYHGTNAEFTTFDRQKIGSATDNGMRGKGFYFSPNKMTSESYGGNVLDAFTSTTNPFDPSKFSSAEEIAEHLTSKLQEKGYEEYSVDPYMFNYGSSFSVKQPYSGSFTSILRDAGYNGIVYPHRQEVVAFDPNQIKSATDNTGEFDVNNDDIRFSKAIQKPERLEKLRQSQPIEITGNEIPHSDDFKQYRKNILQYGLKNIKGDYVNKDTGRTIKVVRGSVTELMHHDMSSDAHIQSITAVPKIIEESIYIDTLPNEDRAKNPDIKEYEYYVAGLRIDGEDYTVKSAIGVSTTGDKYYDHKLTKIEKGNLLEMTSRLSNAEISNSSPLSNIDDKRLLQILQQENQPFDFTHEKSQIATAVGKGLSKHFDVAHSSELGINDPTIEAAYNTKTGKIVIIADNIRANSVLNREERLKWVAWHELAHRGLQVRYGKDFQALMEKVDQNTTIRDLATALQKDRAELKDNRILAIEEAIAELHAAYTTGKMEELKSRYGLVVPRGREISLKSWFRITAERIREFMAKIFGVETANRFSHDDLLNLLKDIQQSAGGDVNGVESDIRHSLNEDPNSSFAKAVDTVSQGGKPSQQYIPMGTTPDVLKMLGVKDMNVTIHRDVLNKVMGDKHNVTADTLKQLPNQINHPVAVMKSAPQATQQGYVVLTELIEENAVTGQKEPVISALHLKATKDGIEVINIASVYGKNLRGLQNMLNHDLLYWNNKKGSQFVEAFGLQLPSKVASNNVNHVGNIKTETDLSQYQNSDLRFSLNEDPNSSFAKAEINPERQAYTFSEAREQAKAFQGKELVNKQSDVRAMVSRNSLDKMLSAKAVNKSISPAIHSLAVANADKLYENALYGWSKPDRDNDSNISAIHRLFAILNSGEGKQLVKLTVKETAQVNRPNRLYTIEAVELNENTPAAQWVGEMLQQDNVEPRTIRSARDIFNLAQSVEKSNSSTDFRFSRSSSYQSGDNISVLNLARGGNIKAKKWTDNFSTIQALKETFKQSTSKIDEWFADSLRPVNDWIDQMQFSDHTSNVSGRDHEKRRLKDAMYTAKGKRDALNSELEVNFLKPILSKVAQIAKQSKGKINEETAKAKAGFWVSARYSIEKNMELLNIDEKAMKDAQTALNDAQINGSAQDIRKATEELARAEKQYQERKVAVWNKDFNNKDFKVGVAGGWSIPEAQEIMRNIERDIALKDLKEIGELIADLNQERLRIDKESGRYTEAEYAQFKDNRNYVPLTGDPNAQLDDMDFIAGAGANSLNIAKDRTLKGRTNSEAEDAIDAVWKAVGKSTTYSGWSEFKGKLDDLFETEVSLLEQQGLSHADALQMASKNLGIGKQKMQGLTRSSDNVLIAKRGGVYYEYSLPDKVISALKNDNVEQANDFLKVLSKPTSWYARGVTQWTLTFAPINMMRDTWEKSEFIRVQKVYDQNGKLLDSSKMDRIGRATALSAFTNRNIWTATKRLAFGQELRDSIPEEKLLKQLLKEGGVSNYGTYLERTEADLLKRIKRENSSLGSKLDKAVGVLESYNKTFDMVSALSAYKALVDNGVDSKQAAATTLELTNFRKTGSKMRGIKALYMFSQPTVMGASNLLKYLSTKKGQIRFLAYTSAMVALYAVLRSMDEEDETGNKMDQLGDITRFIPIPVGNGDYIKIPVGFGMPQMAWNFATNIVKGSVSDISFMEAGVNMVTHATKTFAPVSPSEISAAKYPLEKLALTFTPSILQPLMQNALNRSAFGGKITTNFVLQDRLKAEQSKSTTAQFWKDLAIDIQQTLGFDMHPEQIKNLYDGYSGMLGSLRELNTIFVDNPNREQLGRKTKTWFINQLYGAGNEFAVQSRYYEASEEAQQLANEYNYRKANKSLDQEWLTPERQNLIKWHEYNKRTIGKLRSEKAQLTKLLRAGKISAHAYEQRLKRYNEAVHLVQKKLLSGYRQMEGLSSY